MSGETNLETLLTSMSPVLVDGDYVFCNLADTPLNAIAKLKLKATFYEDEGLSVILEKGDADAAEFDYQGVFRCITLTVHSSLEAVGLTAAIANQLSTEGISANVVAAYYHDHVFVPADQAERALEALRNLVATTSN